MIRTRAAAVAVSVLAVAPAAACYQGFEGTVNSQGPTGNGTDFAAGEDLLVQNTTIVADADDPKSANLVLTVINEGEVDDALVGVSESGGGEGSTDGPVEVPSGRAVQVGGEGNPTIDMSGLTKKPGEFTTLTLQFERAGDVTANVAIVPATGFYEPYGPAGD